MAGGWRVGLFDQCHYRSFLAKACLGAGDATRARDLVEEAIALALHTQQPFAEASAHLARSRVLLTTDGLAKRGEVEASLAGVLGARGHAARLTKELA